MLAGGYQLPVRISLRSTLEARYETLDVLADEEGIFRGNLLATAPSWVTIGVDVGRPEVQPASSPVAEGPCFSRDDVGHERDHRHVESGAHGQGLRKGRGIAVVASVGKLDAAGPRNSVQRLVPPRVRWQADPRDARRLGLGVLDLLLLR